MRRALIALAAVAASTACGDTTSPDSADASSTADAANSASDAAGTDAAMTWPAPLFDGVTGYVEVPDDDAFSQPTSGTLTVEAWMRPDSLDMPNREGSGYVHWLGKGAPGQHEWVARMYQQGNSEGRENRISFYAFNAAGGLGAGSYFQDPVVTGEWIHVVGEIDATRTYIYRDGAPRDSDLLSDYSIVPSNGAAPVRIATRDLQSFFVGSVARVAIYDGKLDDAAVLAHAEARAAGNYDETILAEPSLVGYWKLDETGGTVAEDALGLNHGSYEGGVTPGATTWR